MFKNDEKKLRIFIYGVMIFYNGLFIWKLCLREM